jgi:hypothetical protein
VRLSARFPWFVSQTDADEEEESGPAGDWDVRDPSATLQLVVHWARVGAGPGSASGGGVTPRDPPVPYVVTVPASTSARDTTALCVRCVPTLVDADPEAYILKVRRMGGGGGGEEGVPRENGVWRRFSWDLFGVRVVPAPLKPEDETLDPLPPRICTPQ